MNRKIVLTLDYEIFGNGTGDVQQHVVGPTERMARLCEEHGVPLTVFFEAEEYVAFREYSNELKEALGYDPAQLMSEQIRNLAGRGHDVQLHLHPEWYGAKLEDRRWKLGVKATVDDLFETQEETTSYIAERKAVLEELLQDVVPHGRVTAYRAGAFAAQPGRKLLAALEANDFFIDSSVVHGLHRNGSHVSFDYRQTPAGKRLWRIKDDVTREEDTGLLHEVPIHSVMRRRLHQITPRRLKAKFSANVPRSSQSQLIGELKMGRNPLGVLRFLWQPVPIKLDFHNMSAAGLLRWIVAAPPAAPEDSLDVLVLIGHSKEHIDDHEFARFLRAVSRQDGLDVVTFTWLSELLRDGWAAAPGGEKASATSAKPLGTGDEYDTALA